MTDLLRPLLILTLCCGAAWAQDDKKKDEKKKEKAEVYDTKSDAAVALIEKMAIPPNYKDGKVHLKYTFDDVVQKGDWTAKGLQTFTVDEDAALLNRVADTMYMGLPNRYGVVLHNLALVGDYTITMTLELPSGGAITRGTTFAVLLGFKKKPSIGLVWGQQIVKVKKNFSYKRVTKVPAQPFKNTLKNKLVITRKDNELSLKINGRKIGSKKLKGKDLDGCIGFMGKDLQMTVHDLEIVGTPDPKGF